MPQTVKILSEWKARPRSLRALRCTRYASGGESGGCFGRIQATSHPDVSQRKADYPNPRRRGRIALLRYGCDPSTERSICPIHKALPHWFCRGVRREKSDGSASHPYQCSSQQ